MKSMQQFRIANPLIAGLIMSFVLLLVGTLLVSMLVSFTEMEDESLSVYAYLVHAVACLFGGIACGKRAGKRGWYHGAIFGVLYSMIIMLISYFGFHAALGIHLGVLPAIAIICSVIGGMIGVNTSRG